MAAFSIFTHDNEPAETVLASAREPAVLSYRRRGSAAVEPERARIRQESLPDRLTLPVALRLPDVEQTPIVASLVPWWQMLPVFWIFITLGALLAVMLISGGKKPAPVNDEAPAWSGSAVPSPDASLPLSRAPRADHQPAAVPESGSMPSPPPAETAPAVRGIDLHRPAPPEPNGASLDGSAAQTPAGDLRTARGGNTFWDGSANGARPSEAAPLGISTVPQ
jgi:hypothetical protein